MEKINNARWFRAARVCRRLGGVIIAIVTSGSLCAPASWAATACAVSTQNMATACHAEKQDEFSVALTICANIANAAAAKACRDDANATLSDELELCDAQKTARTAVCALIGQGPYDPDPLSGKTPSGATITFVSPESIGHGNPPNPFFSLAPGSTTVVRVGLDGEQVAVAHVTNAIRKISGRRCRVVADVAMVETERGGTFRYTPSEATDDSYVQAKNGDIYYCGEVTRSFDDAGILRDLEGSWESGVDSAKGGLLIRAAPKVDDADRQEYLPGDAEDIVKYVSLATGPSILQSGGNLPFPCKDRCLKTREFTALEPEVNGFKFYLPGVGIVLAADFAGGEAEDREVTQCVGNSIAAGSILKVLDRASCGIGDPEALLEALCKVSPDAFCEHDDD